VASIFNITGANATQTQTIAADGLYHITVNMNGPAGFGAPKHASLFT
jgi:hypothetical protein